MKVFFRIAAASNWILCVGGILFMREHFRWLGEPVPESLGIYYFSLIVGIYFGYLYWEIARDPLNRILLMRFGLIAKGVGSVAWILLLMLHQLAPSYWFTALVSDILWFPLFLFLYLQTGRKIGKKI